MATATGIGYQRMFTTVAQGFMIGGVSSGFAQMKDRNRAFVKENAVPIYDNLDDSYHDIKDDFFEITLPIGQYDNRFKITFTNSLLFTGTNIKSALIIESIGNTLSIFNPYLIV